jgi:hypothetical protein
MTIFGHIFLPLGRTKFLKKAKKKLYFLVKNHIFSCFIWLYGAQNIFFFIRILAHKMNYGD